MKLGIIFRHTYSNGKDFFRYVEGSATRRIGPRSDSVRAKFLSWSYPYDEIEDNTKFMQGRELILVDEPFITNDELKSICERWCEYANNCSNKEYEHPLLRGVEE